MVAIVLPIPRQAERRLFQHPPPSDSALFGGGTLRLSVPPVHGVEITLTDMTRAEGEALAAALSAARNNEVLVTVPDTAPANASTLTVASVSGLSLTLSGWSGTWHPNKRLSITRGTRRIFVPTIGTLSGSTIQMAATPRVTFQAGDAVTYNSPPIQGLLMNSDQVLEMVRANGVATGLTLMVREML